MLKEITVSGRLCPLGTEETPRFSWKIDSDEKNILQKSYEIEVRSEEAVLWESGLIFSDQSVAVLYQGEALKPRTRYRVLVRVTDHGGTLHEGQTWFETGMLRKEEWKAAWISHRLEEDRPVVFFKAMEPDPARTVKKARIYATALGVYEIEINGQQVGDAFLAPGWTAYQQRLLYQTYDVTHLVRSAGSSLGVEMTVANGWYAGYLNGEGQKHFYGERTAALLMLAVEYEDGSTRFLGTDESWECRYSYIQSADLYMGECQDLSKQDVKGETSPVILLEEDPVPCLMAQESEPVRVIQKFPALQLIRTPREEWVIDFGQNMAGIVEVTLPKPSKENQKDEALTKIRLRHAETLDKDGNFYTENLRTARSADEYLYTAKQAGRKAHPHFTYHGFRYVLVEGIGKPDLADFTALALSSDMKKTGHFETDHPGLDRLASNIEWGMRSNFMDIPTDCPQRDERQGWTGDIALFSPTACFNFDMSRFLEKWLRDLASEQTATGAIPFVVPARKGVTPTLTTSCWGDSSILVPWALYMANGDKGLLERQYPSMKKYLADVKRWASLSLPLHGSRYILKLPFQFGDWCAPYGTLPDWLSKGPWIGTAYFYRSSLLMSRIASILGKKEDSRRYAAQTEKIRSAFRKAFTDGKGRMKEEFQAAYVLALAFDLAQGEEKHVMAERLWGLVKKAGVHLNTGFTATPFLLFTLCDNGFADEAYELLLQDSRPSWLYAVNRGATTIWERWDSLREDGSIEESSLNHYAYGAVGDFFYRRISGLEAIEAGYRRFAVKPAPGGGLTWAECEHKCPYGLIKTRWEKTEGKTRLSVSVPVGCECEVRMPNGEQHTIGSGDYEFETLDK